MQFHNPNKDGDSPYLTVKFNRPNLKHRVKDGECQHVDWTSTRHSNDYALVAFGYGVGTNPNPSGLAGRQWSTP